MIAAVIAAALVVVAAGGLFTAKARMQEQRKWAKYKLISQIGTMEETGKKERGKQQGRG